MPVEGHNLVTKSTCTTCQFSEDFSNYWTAVLYFKARNGTYKRVPQIPSEGLKGDGGITVYYIPGATKQSKVTAFKPGFRMLVGDVNYRDREQARDFRQLTYICMKNEGTRAPESLEFPKEPCPSGIMANHRFPTCWDGVNLDSPDHKSHTAYAIGAGPNDAGPTGKCPASHPVVIPQVMYEVMWDVSAKHLLCSKNAVGLT